MAKIVNLLKYLAVFLLGFVTNFSGVLDSISSIPRSYKEFKRVYLYDGERLAGKWTNNTEYFLGAGDLNLTAGPVLIMQLEANEHDEISGEILSEEICEALPLTWVISVESPEPAVFGIFSNRRLYIKQLRNNRMEIVAIMDIEFLDARRGIVGLKTKHDPLGMLPDQMTLAKGLPEFDNDFKRISEFCAGSPRRFMDRFMSIQE